MADVARRTGVSQVTASFVLGGRTEMRISKASRGMVLKAARLLSYRSKVTGRGARAKPTRTIGLLSDAITSTPFAGEMIRGALDATRAHGDLLIITETCGDRATESAMIHGLLGCQVEAVIYATMYTRYVVPPQELLGHRVVLLNCLAPGYGAPSVVPDEIVAGRLAGQALVAAGHRDGIWAIGGHRAIADAVEGVFAGNERMRGLQEVLRASGASLEGVIECEWSTEDGYREVRGLLARGRRPRALVCSNDRLSFGAYQALAEADLCIPADVSVVSFDDQDIASRLRPALTTLALPHYELGGLSVQLALANGDLTPAVHRVPMLLRERASVGMPGSLHVPPRTPR
ncbi:LacI family DNA-binding transcriptional regulator [Streptomyces sp. GC420]|uniref:LacI family DNA-binding transcriptional regulator n=1 Tax=Streptomyces sp. GC420 TaxID=2697568 RepID=UPI001414EE0D|nr:LacI family DNA-binding transcriptional regulator [Streptomyces sp. GC420]NBM16857.1 substrate-binding domain-containing protein [Streptomyces sp. GC420]